MTAPFMLPYGLKNAAATYASSISTSLSVYADLLGHHLRSTLDLIATPPASSYHEEITSDEDMWASADFSRTGDPKTLLCFLEASNYCLGYSDSDGDDYDPTRECFHLEKAGAALANQDGAGPAQRRDTTPPPDAALVDRLGARAAASAPAGPRCPDLEQLNELEAKLEEECVRLRQLCETLEQDQFARGTEEQPDIALAMSTDTSSRMLGEDPPSSPQPARMSWPLHSFSG